MVVSRRVALFLIAFGVWSWVIWPTFLKNIWADDRSWNDGMTAFFAVHLVLTVVSLLLGTLIGVLGIRALRAGSPSQRADASAADGVALHPAGVGSGTQAAVGIAGDRAHPSQ